MSTTTKAERIKELEELLDELFIENKPRKKGASMK